MSAPIGGNGDDRPSFSFGGLATGLDTSALVDALLAVERRPLDLIEARKADLEQRRSLFQDFNNLVKTLKDALAAVDNRSGTLAGESLDEELLSYLASSEDESVVRADADGNATPGSFSVEVTALASAGRQVTTGYADRDATAVLSSGETLTIDYGGTDSIDITATSDVTLDQLRDAINSDANNGGAVTATIVDTGDAATPYRLVIAGTETGIDNDLTLGGTNSITYDATASEAASDASFTAFGLDFTRSANEVSDAIPGVSLRLVDLGTTTVNVSRDDSAIAGKLQEVADAVNAVRDFVDRQSTVDAETQRGGPLSGDPTLRAAERLIVDGLVRTTSSDPPLPSNSFFSLSDLGLRFDDSGRLQVDQTVMTEALDEDTASFLEVLSEYDESDPNNPIYGIFSYLGERLGPVVQSGDGTLALRDDALDRQIRELDDRIARFEDRLEARETLLTAQFTQLELLVTSLQSQSQFLSSL